jgi:hypothetical protein
MFDLLLSVTESGTGPSRPPHEDGADEQQHGAHGMLIGTFGTLSQPK